MMIVLCLSSQILCLLYFLPWEMLTSRDSITETSLPVNSLDFVNKRLWGKWTIREEKSYRLPEIRHILYL
jgi:hypothetical protein